MKWISRTLGWGIVAVAIFAVSASAKQNYGTLSGVVLDPSGTPQMGASVWLISEDAGGRTISQLISNQHGAFSRDHLAPGMYSVRVAVTGFLPAMEQHVAVVANLTTLLRVQVESVFSSLDTLRRKSDAPSEPDDWKWVLRSSSATRPVLQWNDSDSSLSASSVAGPEASRKQHPRGLVQVTNGALRPGFASSIPDGPATAVSYDQQIGSLGRVLLAGMMSYERGASGSFASVWLPTGDAQHGPETVFVWRQSKFGAAGLEFQAMRLDHTERLALSDRLSLEAGAEYLRAGILTSASAIRPHAQLTAALAPGWMGALIVASNPPSELWGRTGELETMMSELDSLPPVLFHNGSPVLEGGWHEEISVKHKLTTRSSLDAAAFHDSMRHEAIFGNGPAAANPDFIQDAFSTAFLYDGGSTSSWGARVAYRQKISDNLEIAAIYSWAGALTPEGALNVTSADLRDNFTTSNHHSVAARVTGKIPHVDTQFAASYKWVTDTTLTRMDPFGEAAYQIDPYLHLSFRQPLPGLSGRWEALADFSNLLGQGYLTLNGQDSRTTLMPVLRSFRGGVSFQF